MTNTKTILWLKEQIKYHQALVDRDGPGEIGTMWATKIITYQEILDFITKK